MTDIRDVTHHVGGAYNVFMVGVVEPKSDEWR